MLPDDLPENVIPFRPRKQRVPGRAEKQAAPQEHGATIGDNRADRHRTGKAGADDRQSDSSASPAAARAQYETRGMTAARNTTLLPAMPALGAPAALGATAATTGAQSAAAAAKHPSQHPAAPDRQPDRPDGRTGERAGELLGKRTGERAGGMAQGHAATLLATAGTGSGISPAPAGRSNVTSMAESGGKAGTGPEPQSGRVGKAFSWRRVLLLLAGSFLLGIGIASAAIAIGADIVGLWPHGFAFYAMLVGGGMTMLLTSALMMALFYSDSSGHDDVVQQFRPSPRRPLDMPPLSETKPPRHPER